MLLTAALTGCAVQMPLSVSSTCAVWIGIGWSPKDTDQTIHDVKENNARREAYCQGVK